MSTQVALPFKKRKRGDLTPLPSSSSSTCRPKYEVFLSFRGVDTRKSFTDHLYNALKNKGIFTFRDDEELQRGKAISQELLKAIKESIFAIVIFSKNYASSSWCLDELVHIVRCKKETGLKIVPVFYDVNPTDVRKQTGTFAQAFDECKERFKESIEKLETWKIALKEVADLSGYDLQDRHEFEFIQHIVKKMMEMLNSKSLSNTKNFIGIESAMEKLIPSYLGFENNVCMIGIYGMGGLGKTTLARAVYDEFRSHFESSCFIANVREDSKKHGLPKLQKQLFADILKDRDICINNIYDGVDKIKKWLCRKKVLLVIDDVDHLDQLEKLAREPGWFGLGSWIIITTRDESVLTRHGVHKIYNPKLLNNGDALKLFCLKAFKTEQPKEGYMQLSQKVVEYANGLPLALVTLGSFLNERTIDDWQSTLNNFKETKGETFDILKISYDGLEEMWKKIFLDIACFFRGYKKAWVLETLKNCGINARIGISVLVEKSLLTIYNECLGMHDLIQEMSEKIVRLESGGNLGKQSRLWLSEDLFYVLENDMATEAIQAIVVTYREEDFNFEEFSEGFSKMSNLRLLIIDSLKRKEQDILNALYHVANDQRDLALPNNLGYLLWTYCPFKCLASNLKRMAFVQLHLSHSKFEYPWEGAMRAATLKFIDLSDSKSLIRTPDFSGVPMLEGLNLSRCYSLVEIHPSIGQLSRFWYLYLQQYGYLFSMFAEMQSLTVLDLSHSDNLIWTPDFSGVPILEKLYLSHCPQLVEIHPSIGQLSKLRYLYLNGCKFLSNLPTMGAIMQSLTVLDLDGCKRLSSFPKFTGIMKSLPKLKLCNTTIKKLASSSITCLTALTLLDLSYCDHLKCLPSNMDNLRSLETLNLSWCGQLVKIPPSIGQLSRLRYLDLQHCYNLTDLPPLPSEMQSLTVLNIHGCSRINSFPKFTGIMKSLLKLNMEWTNIKKVALSSIKCLTALSFLNLRLCSKLESLPRLPSTVRYIEAKGCSSLKWSPEWVKLSSWSQPLSQWLPFDESGSRVGFAKLFHFLQGLLCRKAVLDGSIIPSRLAIKEGNSISIKLPSNWYNSKWIGFALWASLSDVADVDVKYGIRARVIALGDMPQNHCASEHFTTYIRDENSICLLYLSHDDWFATVGNDECSQIKVIFEYKNSYMCDHQKKSTIYIEGECGVSLIYKQGVDEFNKTDLQCLIKSFGEVSIYKLTAVDDNDDVHIVDDDDDDVYIVGDDDDNVLIVGDDDFDDDDI